MSIVLLVIFLFSLLFTLGGLYLLFSAPSRGDKIRARLDALRETGASGRHATDVEEGILRDDVLSHVPALHQLLLKIPFLNRLGLFLRQAAVEKTAAGILWICLWLALVVFLLAALVGMPVLLSLALAAAGGAIPFAVIAFKRRRRFSKFEEQFPEAMDLLARAVRAGHAFTTGLELIGTELPEPVAGEFRTTFEQQNLGLPLREALQNLAVRVPLPDVRIFVTALQIQRESGGNLAEVLDKLSEVVRERFKLYRQIDIHTAEGRLSLYLLTGLPPLAAIMMLLVNPEYMRPLWTEELGQKMIAGAVVLQIVGYLVIQKIIRIKV